ncbi:MAG: coproporphyrinogen III oxidase [Cyanobacteria bacterium REEB459]|nr:coproporphyrinogen III oxidase [Cyanobacteria bacterium REEB459]
MTGDPTSAYVHIPFCRRRCFYCDFPITVLGHQNRGETSGTVDRYLALLATEIAATPAGTQPLETIFFGGGTPSLLAVDQVERILAQLEQRFGLAPRVEISMEMDPGTFDLAHLQGYLGAGVNRISLGVQALDDTLLESCGRYHRVAQVYEAVEWLHHVGMDNWSLDLISGLPHQTLEGWRLGLERAVDLGCHHLSLYDLSLEPQTVFAKRYRPGLTPLPTEDQTAAMYRIAHTYLGDRGYHHYEVSNYAQPGHECRHNLTYWHNQPYYGFGLGATSYTQRQRVSRPRTQASYRDWVEHFQQRGGRHPQAVASDLDPLLETLMLGLRLHQGIAGSELRSLCHPATWRSLYEILQPHIQRGWVVMQGPSWAELEVLRLSVPEGFLFSNQVLASCFALEDLPRPA